MKKKKKKKSKKRLTLTQKAQLAMEEAVRGVIQENIQAGLPLVVWKNGKITKIPPEKLKKAEKEIAPEKPAEWKRKKILRVSKKR